jgi:hypothetical protein
MIRVKKKEQGGGSEKSSYSIKSCGFRKKGIMVRQQDNYIKIPLKPKKDLT